MIEKKKLLKYDSYASDYIENKDMSLRIQRNINFVLNYKDYVKEIFKKPVERQIVYKELGTIVLSCIEALAKTIIDSFKKRCTKCKYDNEKCDYKLFPDEKGSSKSSLQYLFDVRFFHLSPDEFDEFKQLNELRNYIHISKNISETINDNVFNLDYVHRTLDCYYVLIDQLDLTGDYFFGKTKCLKILDDDGIKDTKRMNKSDRQIYYSLKMSPILRMLLRNEKLSEDDKWVLKRIDYPEDVDFDELLRYINNIVLHGAIGFKNDADCNKAKNAFKKRLLKFISKEEYIERIKNEI